MILHVEFDHFAATVKRMLESKEVFARPQGGAVVLTAGHPSKSFVVGCFAREPYDQVRKRLSNEGLEVLEGEWTDGGETVTDRLGDRQTYIAAVAYHSREKMPGLWLDAYPAPPVPGLVLRNFYNELSENGEIAEVNFEEFLRLANPNVVVIGPNEIQDFLSQKETC